MPLQGNVGVERMCQLAGVSRAGFYRYLRRGWQWEEEVALRSTVQDVVIEHRWRYGYRRVTEELRARGRLMRASTSAKPFEARCDTHLCLSEGFTLQDF